MELGFQPLAIVARLRHEKIETTLNTYSHLYPNKQAELADRLHSILVRSWRKKQKWKLSEYLNRDICQPEGFDAYGYPSELFKLDMERLGIAAKRKPAKVIDFAQYIENNRGTND